MGHSCCCVANCKNTGRNSSCKFCKFPSAPQKLGQRQKWIAAVRKINSNADGSLWTPRSNDRICSAHFIGNQRSDVECSPSYIPVIFSSVFEITSHRQSAKIERHERFLKRRSKKLTAVFEKDNFDVEMAINQSFLTPYTERIQMDKECQVDFLSGDEPLKTFICNRYMLYGMTHCDVEIQTEIVECKGTIKIPNSRKFKDVECNTAHTVYVDKEAGPNFESWKEINKNSFTGIESIKNDEELVDVAGVTFDNFKLLLKMVDISIPGNISISKENRLLIFLCKMKTGMTFSAMDVFFSVHRTTTSRIFFSMLHIVACATKNLVFWSEKHVVQATMPECFHPEYSRTRVIIDCTEFKIEVPAAVDNRVSHLFSLQKRLHSKTTYWNYSFWLHLFEIQAGRWKKK